MREKILPVVLRPSEYRELARRAEVDERHPVRHAAWIIKQYLGDGAGAVPTDDMLTTGSRGPGEAA